MSNFELHDYVEVAERISEFYRRHPEGRLWAEIVERSDALIVMRGFAARTPDDPLPAVAHSWLAIPGSTPYTRGSEVENAETSAIGRAIVLAGIPSKKVASADEVRSKTASRPPARAADKAPAVLPPAAGATPTIPHGGWSEGMKHAEDHRPLRARQNGSLYCPTKLPDGRWCNWKHDGPPPTVAADEPPLPPEPSDLDGLQL